MLSSQRTMTLQTMLFSTSVLLILMLSAQTVFCGQSQDQSLRPHFEGTNLRFFETGRDLSAYGAREYATHFLQSQTRYVGHELHLKHPLLGNRYDFVIKAAYIRPDGSTLGNTSLNTRVEASWNTSAHATGWGWEEPGKWPVGKYTVKVFIDEREVAGGFFWIDADKLQTDDKFLPSPKEKNKNSIPDDLGEL